LWACSSVHRISRPTGTGMCLRCCTMHHDCCVSVLLTLPPPPLGAPISSVGVSCPASSEHQRTPKFSGYVLVNITIASVQTGSSILIFCTIRG
jgi:hypothetical protein